MILVNSLFTLAFLYFAYLNLNDPDAWLWVSIYLVAAAGCGASLLGWHFPIAYLVVVALYLIYAVILFFTKDGVWDWMTKHKMAHIAATMQATQPWIEKTREFFGLLIASAALLLNYFMYR